MEVRLVAPVARGYFFLSALRASLNRLRREPSVSITQKYSLEPRIPLNNLFLNNWHFEVINREIKHRVFGKRQTYICTTWPSFPVNCRLPVHYNYTKIGRFTPILFITTALICWPLISHFVKFLNLNLPFAAFDTVNHISWPLSKLSSIFLDGVKVI